MIVSIFLSLCYCTLGIFATGKHINHSDEYGLDISTNLQSLHFHGTEKAIKLAKKSKITKIEENLNETVKSKMYTNFLQEMSSIGLVRYREVSSRG